VTRYAPILLAALRRAAIALAALIGGYALLGLVGGAIPANRGWTPPPHGIRIFVETNGVHVGLVVPKVAAGVDWRGWAPARDLADPRYAGYDHLAIGWGEQGFFLGTPHWSDVRPGTIIAAAIGSERTLIHLEHVPVPQSGGAVRAIVLRPEEYRRLAAYVQASFAPGGARYRGYDTNDAFYQARGHYDARRNCNAWTGSALRHAGVRVGWWTPFPLGIMAWF
jgi:uncharacterized protein (TIGR02117 family)